MSFLDKVQRCNRRDLSRFVPFIVEGVQVGWLSPERAKVLGDIPAVFAPVDPADSHDGITMSPGLGTIGFTTPDDRTRAVDDVADALVGSGLFNKPRRELYGVKNRWSDAELLRLDRAFVPGFGVRAYGVHVNGWVRRADGPHLWIGTRAANLKVEPGKLDNMVAGGQPAGLSLMDNLVKECGEEAGLDEALARRAVSIGTISYAFEAREGLKVDTLFCYDLDVPAGFTPKPSDEIVRFDLMPIADVLALIRDTDRFKFNVNLVILDFAMRHGVLSADQERDYELIVAGLHERPQPIV